MKKILILLVLLVILTGCANKAEATQEKLDTKALGDITENVIMGDKDADNEMLLVFDYECRFCDDWVEQVLPVIKSDYIDNGFVKFRSQSMSLLSQRSLALSDFDQNVKRYNPTQYYSIMGKIMSDKTQVDDWGTDDYISRLITDFNLDFTLETDVEVDSLQFTRLYTRSLKVESVPTLIVNGIKVDNAFNLTEIIKLLK